jgi:tripartite ATP-independent transporter DctM subunit
MIGGVLGLALLIVLIIVGVPIAISFGALALFLVLYFQMTPSFLAPAAFYTLKSPVLLAAPFFILLGIVMARSALSLHLVNFANTILGWMRGGLGMASIVACAMFGAIGGSCSAAVAAVGTIMIPRLQENGYPRGYSTALVACSSILGQLIPPSVPMILFALVTLQSVPGCWAATVGPGIITIGAFSVINYFMVRNLPNMTAIYATPVRSVRAMVAAAGRAAIRAWASLLLAGLVLGGVYGGIFTPAESASVGSVLAIGLVLVRRLLAPKQVTSAVAEAATTSGVLMIMIFFMMICTRTFTLEMIPQKMAEALLQVSSEPIVILLMVNVFLLVIGMLMDDASGSLLAGALLFPVVTKIGVHPLHFAAIVGVNLGLGNVTPPCAPILYLAGYVGNSTMDEYIKPALVLMWGGMLPVLLLTTWWPGLSLFLPSLLGYVH